MNLIFFGTSEFGIPALTALKKAGMAPMLVVSTPDRPRGRKLVLSESPIKEWAEKNRIETITPATLNDPGLLHILQAKNPDVFIVASYGKIIPKKMLDIPRKGTINIHPSLLPRFRGPSPIQTAILENAETGVTLMLTDEEVDHGPILAQQELEITNNKLQITNNLTYKELEKELAELGASMLIETLPRWISGEIIPQEQDHSYATFTKKILKDDGHIHWEEPAEIIERKIRAFNPWPGTFTFYEKDGKKKRLLILKTHRERTDGKVPPGTVIKMKSGECAIAASDSFLVIEIVKPEGKNEMNGNEFLKGNPVTHFS